MWETTYRNDRRQHRHRCRCCSRIIEPGEQVVMWRMPGRRTAYAIHLDCADQPHPCGTMRDAIIAWTTNA